MTKIFSKLGRRKRLLWKTFSKLSRRKRILWTLGIIVFVSLLLAKPVYHVFRDWQVESNATEAGAALSAAKLGLTIAVR